MALRPFAARCPSLARVLFVLASALVLAPGSPRAQSLVDAAAPHDESLADAGSARWEFGLVTAPPGQPIPLDGVRPASMPGRLVAWRAPIAVHGAMGTSVETLNAVCDAAVRALDAFERDFGLPQPAPDGVRGGGPELDLYVLPDGPPVDVQVDALEQSALWDRASAFASVRGDLSPSQLERAVTEAVAHAILLGIDARSPRPWRIAFAASLAGQVTGLGPDDEAIARFQRDPSAALFANRDDASARGAAVFLDYIVQRYDDGAHGLVRGLAWMPVARTPANAPRLRDEPDVFDVMERLFRSEPGGLEGVLGDFALARGLLGSAGDEIRIAAGSDNRALAPDLARSVRYAELPVWVTPSTPLDKTGTAYVSIDTRGAREGRINLWFHGVPWRSWVVGAVRLDETGREIGRVPAAAVVHGEWSAALEELTDTARILVAITDLGNRDYDPDVPPDRTGFFALNIGR